MKPMVLAGLLFIALGVIALGYQGFTYVTRERVVDAGPVHISAEREKTVWIPPIVGAGALAIGTVLMILGTRKPTAA